MKLKLLLAGAGLAILFTVGVATQAQAAFPNCGGNSNGPRNVDAAGNLIVPWTCQNTKTIAGVTGAVTGVLTVADGNQMGVVTVVVTLAQPQTFDVTLLGVWSKGVSSGPDVAVGQGVIPAGQTTATVITGKTSFCDGQFDFQVNKPAGVGRSNLYRLHGPWLKVLCAQQVAATTTTTVPATTVPGQTTVPSQPTTTIPAQVSPVTLPATGKSGNGVPIALVAAGFGVFLLMGATRRRARA